MIVLCVNLTFACDRVCHILALRTSKHNGPHQHVVTLLAGSASPSLRRRHTDCTRRRIRVLKSAWFYSHVSSSVQQWVSTSTWLFLCEWLYRHAATNQRPGTLAYGFRLCRLSVMCHSSACTKLHQSNIL